MSPLPFGEAVMKAVEHVNLPIVIERDDTILFGIMLADALSQFGVDVDPAGAWLSLVDAYAVYGGTKEQVMKRHPQKVKKRTIEVLHIETPLEKVYTPEYLRELGERGWLPKYLCEK